MKEWIKKFEKAIEDSKRFFYRKDIVSMIFFVLFYLSIFLLVPQFIIGILYLLCGCSLPLMWFIAEEKVTAFFSFLILLLWFISYLREKSRLIEIAPFCVTLWLIIIIGLNIYPIINGF